MAPSWPSSFTLLVLRWPEIVKVSVVALHLCPHSPYLLSLSTTMSLAGLETYVSQARHVTLWFLPCSLIAVECWRGFKPRVFVLQQVSSCLDWVLVKFVWALPLQQRKWVLNVFSCHLLYSLPAIAILCKLILSLRRINKLFVSCRHEKLR